MTGRLLVEPGPAPLEEYAARFDDLFGVLSSALVEARALERLVSGNRRSRQRGL